MARYHDSGVFDAFASKKKTLHANPARHLGHR
jgi:hypothetical protein